MTDFNKKIMRRVYAIWFVRKIGPALFLEIPILAIIALHETAREFFVAKIMENFLVALNKGFDDAFVYSFHAAMDAPAIPMLVISFSLVLCGVLGYKVARNFYNFKMVTN